MSHLLAADAAAAVLDPDGGSAPLATAHRVLDTLGGAEVGVWEAGPGSDTDVEADEVFVVLGGAAVVGLEDGSRLELRPGTAACLAAGDRTTWEVSERLRKLYVTGAGLTPAPAGGGDLASSRLLMADVATAALREESHPGAWVVGGWPTASGTTLGRVADARISVWEVTTGVVADIETDEVLVVLAGSGSLRPERSAEIALRPGSVVRLADGDRVEWTVAATLRTLLVTAAS